MKKYFYLTIVLTSFCLYGLMLTVSPAHGADIATPEKLSAGSYAKITQQSQNINAIVGNTAIIKAIRGNQITLNAVNDSRKITNITVDNASIFKVGQQVDIKGTQLIKRRIATPEKGAPSTDMMRRR